MHAEGEDPSAVERYRAQSLRNWTRAAAGWEARRDRVQRIGLPVSRWLIDAVRLQPGHTVLELAAGPGDTGLLAAELISPAGTLLVSDFAEPMLDVARRRAGELGIENVEFRLIDAESIDLDTASVDAVLCRWGYMLFADPAAALRETRRVLRVGGRVALAAWAGRERNPWVALPNDELLARGLMQAPPADAPGMFAFAPAGRIERLLADAGLGEIEVDAVELEQRYASFEDWWAMMLDLGRPMADVVESLEDDQRADLERALRERVAPYATGTGNEIVMPGVSLVATASA